ncbi:MAG: amylo-alpha-1,6-glucosidase [Candidatus Methylacidiphilales bacterium]|nr:trehalase family glycosidase [Candidatus Methylacidiphilales bacterium]
MWNRGQLVAFSGLDGATDYSEGLVARTVTGPDGIEIRDPGTCTIVFSDPAATGGSVQFGGDYFSFTGQNGSVTRGAMVDGWHLIIQGPCSIGEVTAAFTDRTSTAKSALCIAEKNGRVLVGSRTHFNASLIDADIDALIRQRSAWLTSQELPKNLSPLRRQTLARAFNMMKSQVYSPEGVIKHRWTTPDRWPHKDMWLWDSAFHAIGWRHIDPVLAREFINAVFDTQCADGFIAHRMSPRGAVSEFTQAPVLADAVSRVHAFAPDPEWVRDLLPRLEAYLQWDMANRDKDGAGLVEWFIEDDPVCRSGESGMDNSPRFDSARPLDAVDFNAFLARECEVMAGFAEALGMREKAAHWCAHYTRLCALINERLWCEKAGFYFDFDPSINARTAAVSSAGFMPLICGAASQEQAIRLAAHLTDPQMFGTEFPVASIARKDTEHYSKDMWRGPVWVNINWLLIQGLERYGLRAEADHLRSCTVAEIERHCGTYGTFFEYYDDRNEVDPPELLRKGVCNPANCFRQVIHEFGWTATLYVDLVLGRKGRAEDL